MSFRLLVAFFLIASLRGQDFLDKEFVLAPLAQTHLGDDFFRNRGGMICGKYFYRHMIGKHAIVYFEFFTVGRDGQVDRNSAPMVQDHIKVVTDKSKSVPTAVLRKMKDSKDPIPFRWTIWLSEEDQKESVPCLSPPAPAVVTKKK